MSGMLIIRLKGLGDIVHLIPSLRMLRQTRPEMPLALLCQRPFGQIIPAELGVKIFELPAHAGVVETFKLLRRLRREKFDCLFDFFANSRTALISLLSGARRRYGFDYRVRRHAYHQTYAPTDPNLHLMQLFAQFFAEFGFAGPIEHPQLKPVMSEELCRFYADPQIKRPLLGINPHTTYPSKAWPEEYFIEFIRLWHARTGLPVLVTWGPGEIEAARRIIAAAGPEKCVLQPKVDIGQFAALLAGLDIFLTADTGPMNIAWAVGTPTVAMFGPTTRKAVAPVGDDHLTLFNPEVECLQCHLEQCSHKKCMYSMKPEWVLAQIVSKFNLK